MKTWTHWNWLILARNYPAKGVQLANLGPRLAQSQLVPVFEARGHPSSGGPPKLFVDVPKPKKALPTLTGDSVT